MSALTATFLIGLRAGVNPNRIVEIEQGDSDPRLSTVEKVVGALGLRIRVEAA